MANWLAAILQVSGGFFHDLVMLRKARKMSFVAASSLGKCPSVLEHLAQLHMQTSIVDALASLDGDFVLDGELVALDSQGRPSFQVLQNNLSRWHDPAGETLHN